jgi:hypothetical protein
MAEKSDFDKKLSATPWMSKNEFLGLGTNNHTSRRTVKQVSPDAARKPTSVFKAIKKEKGEPERVDLTNIDDDDFGGEEKIPILKMPVTPIDVMVMQNHCFFNYDPSGYPVKKVLPVGYCSMCRCPDAYCAQKVFGEMCIRQSEYEVYVIQGMSAIDPRDTDRLQVVFEKVYTGAVKHKMMWNNIKMNKNFHANCLIDLPRCIKRKSFRQFVRSYKYECEADQQKIIHSSLTTLDPDYEIMKEMEDTKKPSKYHSHFTM